MTDVLLIIDVQRALLDELGTARADELVETLVPLVDRARASGTPVVYVRHDGSPEELLPGTPSWEIAADIAPQPADPIVEKRSSDAFAGTRLSDVLAGLDADHLITAGMQTDYCVNATIGGAIERGYRVTLVADGHATPASGGRSEAEIRAAMHAANLERGARIVSSSELFP